MAKNLIRRNTGYKGDTRRKAEIWIDDNILKLKDAIETKGESHYMNILNYKSYLRDFQKSTLKSDFSAYEMGKKAFHEGRMKVPAHDPNLMEILKDRQIGESTKDYKDWARGWDEENLKAPVPGIDQPKPISDIEKRIKSLQVTLKYSKSEEEKVSLGKRIKALTILSK